MPVYIDINRCIGCRTCEAACQMEHGGRGHINFDAEKCTGCGLCIYACPFGVVWADRTAHKCDLCRERKGGPACISVCPAKALSVDFDLEVSRARSHAARAAADPRGVR